MKIFLSWSGTRSKQVAIALRNWIPLLLHYADPWLSDKDIEAGERWSIEVGKELESSNFGIICLTPENLKEEWILFEAGALSKALQISSVCPYLLEVDFSEISGPLSQFQAKKAERNQTLELLEAINNRSPNPIDAVRLTELFDPLWPKLEERLGAIPTGEGSKPALRNRGDVLEELVLVVRSFDSRLSDFEQTLTRQVRKSRPSGEEVVRGHIRISMTPDFDTPKVKAGSKRQIECVRAGALTALALVAGLNVDLFGEEWWLRDPATTELIDEKALRQFLNRPECDVIITDISF